MRKQMCNVMFGALKAFLISIVLLSIFYIAIGIVARAVAGW